ncbi:MAG: cation acetate symporter [Actinomycetota bacterium]
MIATTAVLLVVGITIILGTASLRYARTTSNFFVASRSVNPVWNAFAVCGETMSAASYLGVPALILVFGVDMLWTLVGWTIGFLLLSLFIAAPVRRFGSYTIPEFVEGRLDAPQLRPLVAIAVIVASGFFLLAQLKGAGVVARELTGAPYWVGVVVVGVLVASNLSAGGMRGITFVQGFQFFFVVLGLLVPFILLSASWTIGDREPLNGPDAPAFLTDREVSYPTEVEIDLLTTAVVDADGTIDGAPVDGAITLDEGRHVVAAGSTITWTAGTPAPHEQGVDRLTGEEWAAPLGDKSLGGGHPLYFSYAIVLANMFGIISLPHIVVRFYTNPTGREARRTNVWVLALIAPYYAMLPLIGGSARQLAPEVLGNGNTDSATIVVGQQLADGLRGELIEAVVSAGAAAAFLSTAAGLLIAMAGALSHDILSAGVPQFRLSVWAAAAVAIVAGLAVEQVDINILIGWSTSIAASSIGPLLVLGIWWTGFTRRGAVATVVIGGTTTTLAVVATIVGVVESGWPLAILQVPAAWSVPLAFAVGIVVSLADKEKVSQIGHKFALMHLPERTGDPGTPS